MERSGPSIEMKVVLLVVAALLVQDLVLLVLYVSGAHPQVIQIVLGAVLAFSLVVAAVWGNAISRAIRRLTRACYVARKGDVAVLADLTRTDELGQLNSEINRLVILLREAAGTRAELGAGRDVVDELERTAPEIMRSSHELLISLRELNEGAEAETAIMRKVSGRLQEARELVERVALAEDDGADAREAATRLAAMEALASEAELLADSILDEVARPSVDEAALARVVNSLRNSVRDMAAAASLSVEPLRKRREDLECALRALDRLDEAEKERADASRVAELMSGSASGGMSEASRLAGHLRRLGIALQALSSRRRRNP